MPYQVTLIPGDGIGPEITEQTLRVLDATGIRFDWDPQPAGLHGVERMGDPLPSSTIESCVLICAC